MELVTPHMTLNHGVLCRDCFPKSPNDITNLIKGRHGDNQKGVNRYEKAIMSATDARSKLLHRGRGTSLLLVQSAHTLNHNSCPYHIPLPRAIYKDYVTLTCYLDKFYCGNAG